MCIIVTQWGVRVTAYAFEDRYRESSEGGVYCQLHMHSTCGDMYKLSNLSSAKLGVLHFLFLAGL